MAKLIWGDAAVYDLERIYDYIARDSHQYARHQVERIYRLQSAFYSSPNPAVISLNFPTFPTVK
ncbi:MAG: hypothetical protein A2010_05240 [Nitrospirae bacterium GWD2_57_9]|nr:MAG: hypothetical protein A2010_05240 [Nitrospirae bacterium GWD2_57_9]